ncbi:galactose mutarotase [Mucilaginibacter pallidiroseus]|uniref:Aldose 1-epimerase n=1 Tax=Mucilaginibacter pallidiroseus TaxID=2599295 RepID=A0A563U248_9SPHI|nr:aldose epimerase family protein [Mucilaginibacter pallidiroseus]TWR25161.1 galactose mutarotase [Mucilaginibacter pallidiroseus]
MMTQNKSDKKYWGEADGMEVYQYSLTNRQNTTVTLSNFGSTIIGIQTADRRGNVEDIVLGYDHLDDYINDKYYMGGMVGRFANRIAGGQVKLNGQQHQLNVTDGGYHHHGGKVGFNKRVWKAAFVDNVGLPAIQTEYLSPHGEEGFPGNLSVKIIYTLNDDNQLIIDTTAFTDATTLINLTQHTYFNLAGHNSGCIEGHYLFMPHTHYLPVNATQVPNGSIAETGGTPFDFTAGKKIGAQINAVDEQLALGHGYDHSWVIKNKNSNELKLAARAAHMESGRTLAVYTTEPAVHLYTGNFLNVVAGKDNAYYGPRHGFCLETQQYPDAPNKPHFPSTILQPGQFYKSRTIYEFRLDAIG